MKKEYLKLGRITGTHGLKGEMRFEPWCDSPDFVKKFTTLYRDPRGESSVKVEGARTQGNIVLLRLAGVDDVDSASLLRGHILWMKRSDAEPPEGRWYVEELIGCRVIDADDGSKFYGELRGVTNSGASDIWEIEKDGREYLFPAVADMIESVDIDAGVIAVRPIKGLFDDGAAED